MPPRRRHVGTRGPAPVGRGPAPVRREVGGTAGVSGTGEIRVLIDGRNVQHALARASGGSVGPTVALVARLRAAFAPPTEVELVLDGHPAGGPSGRLAPGFSVSYSRHATADQVIGDRVAEALVTLGPAGAWSVMVVTDDREVRDNARRNGARVEGSAWLVERLGHLRQGAGTPLGVPLGHGRPRRRSQAGR